MQMLPKVVILKLYSNQVIISL